MNKADFQGTLGKRSVNLYMLTNSNGLKASVTNYGARLVELLTPDTEGHLDNIVVGHPSMKALLNNKEEYFGAVVGRYANRIAKGTFTLDGREFQLPQNEGPNHLHGGPPGFHQVVWGADQVDEQTLRLSYRSVDGEGGYPGNLGVSVIYQLTDNDELHVSYQAEADERTILNMTHHAYYNLYGTESGASVDSHQLMINANQFTPVDEHLIPTGDIESVENTPLDFRTSKSIGEERKAAHPFLEFTDGYDHNFVLDREEGEKLQLAARVEDPASGRSMELYTSEPGLQLYVCEDPVENVSSAFCLEPQHFPDSPNNPRFPSTVLDAFESYKWKMVIALNT